VGQRGRTGGFTCGSRAEGTRVPRGRQESETPPRGMRVDHWQRADLRRSPRRQKLRDVSGTFVRANTTSPSERARGRSRARTVARIAARAPPPRGARCRRSRHRLLRGRVGDGVCEEAYAISPRPPPPLRGEGDSAPVTPYPVGEGVRTSGAAIELSRRRGVERPIAEGARGARGDDRPEEAADRRRRRQLRSERE
jgi:hypothetical protein